MGTHPIFESDFDCLTERKCQQETLRLANQHQHSTLKLWSMGNSRTFNSPTTRANMLFSSSIHLTLPLSVRPKSLPFPRVLSSSRKLAAKRLPAQLTPSSPTWPGPIHHARRAVLAP